jgi:hypothetical protein
LSVHDDEVASFAEPDAFAQVAGHDPFISMPEAPP